MLVGVPTAEVEFEPSHWRQEQLKGTVYIVGKHNDVYEIIIDPVYLPRLKYQYQHLGLNLDLDYNPTSPRERQKDVYGMQKASKDARTLWLCYAAQMVRSEKHPEVQPAYQHFARLNGLHEALARAIIVYDISGSLSLQKLPNPLLIYFSDVFSSHSKEFGSHPWSLVSESYDRLRLFACISLPCKQRGRST